MKIAAIDIDDTLADMSGAFAKVIKYRKLQEQSECFDWASKYGLTQEQLVNILQSDVDFLDLRCFSQLWVEVFCTLKQHNVKPVFVTSRGSVFDEATAKHITGMWLYERLGIGLDSHIVVTTLGHTKAQVLKDMNYDVVFSIDDSPKEHNGYVKAWPQAFNCLAHTQSVPEAFSYSVNDDTGLRFLHFHLKRYLTRNSSIKSSLLQVTQ